MNILKIITFLTSMAFIAGCATSYCPAGAQGPELVTSGRSTPNGHYAEVGLEFSTWGDFVALVSPNRWKSPVAVGGSLSWLNPSAWNEDAGRTGRILMGEAVVVGGVVAVAGTTGDGGGSSGGSVSTETPTPPPPTSGGGQPPTPPIN